MISELSGAEHWLGEKCHPEYGRWLAGRPFHHSHRKKVKVQICVTMIMNGQTRCANLLTHSLTHSPAAHPRRAEFVVFSVSLTETDAGGMSTGYRVLRVHTCS